MSDFAPFHILAGPFDIYIAPPAEAQPEVDAAPAGNWALLGTNGKKSYTEEGVRVRPEQDVEDVYVLGSSGIVKQFRTRARLIVGVDVYDATVENVAKALNDAAVTSVAAASGTPGYKRVSTLMPAGSVAQFSLLIRGTVSPYGDTWNSQWWIPRCSQRANIEAVYSKGVPVGIAMEFVALDDDSDGFGHYTAQDATALA